MDQRADGGDEDSFIARWRLVQTTFVDALGDGFGEIFAGFLGREGRVFRAGARKDPMEVGMREVRGEAASVALAAWFTGAPRRVALAEQELREPERGALFPDAARAVEQEARRERVSGDGGAEPTLQRFLTNERDEGHAGSLANLALGRRDQRVRALDRSDQDDRRRPLTL